MSTCSHWRSLKWLTAHCVITLSLLVVVGVGQTHRHLRHAVHPVSYTLSTTRRIDSSSHIQEAGGNAQGQLTLLLVCSLREVFHFACIDCGLISGKDTELTRAFCTCAGGHGLLQIRHHVQHGRVCQLAAGEWPRLALTNSKVFPSICAAGCMLATIPFLLTHCVRRACRLRYPGSLPACAYLPNPTVTQTVHSVDNHHNLLHLLIVTSIYFDT